MRRVLKPAGVSIVVDALSSDGEFSFEIILQEFIKYLPRHSRYGISSAEAKHVLEENELNIRSEETARRVIILQVEPKNT